MREFTETKTHTFTIACPKGDGGAIVKVGKQKRASTLQVQDVRHVLSR